MECDCVNKVKAYCSCKDEEGNCTCNLECMKRWTRMLHIGSAFILAALGIGRFFSITEMLNPFSWVLNVYLIALGFITICCDLGWEKILVHFNFLRYYLGKSGWCLFIGCLIFDEKYWFQIVVACVFFFNCSFYLVLGIFCLKYERESQENGENPENKPAEEQNKNNNNNDNSNNVKVNVPEVPSAPISHNNSNNYNYNLENQANIDYDIGKMEEYSNNNNNQV